ncbi:AI-2E family transporter [Erysipelothrix sp. HDW6A]|uniref:AI-2E family transporter n=1 Tax=Erysipelothrix sp. HDW6A TaxID=2714928 RepID=UPI00140D65DF|nr:AI-2E family transporter [Erysipelothrix sp. HDW6A]QIK57412.1 AI-2E family transporter [Erysipelothrix sp. HDW6A]
MGIKSRISEYLNRYISIKRLVMVLMTLGIVYLIMLTDNVWLSVYAKGRAILMPFIIGFAIAFVLRPITIFFERFNIKRQISVPITMLLFVFVMIFLFSSIIPNLISDLVTFIGSGAEGIQKLVSYYTEVSDSVPSPWVNDMVAELTGVLKSLVNQLSNIPVLASQFISSFISFLTTGIFSLVISLYLIFDYENVTSQVLKVANRVSPKLSNSLIVVNRAVVSYLKSLVVLMTVSMIEYALFYSLIGHDYALILGVMAAFGILIPYIGAVSVQVLAFLTGLTLPFPRPIILAIGLVVLSNVDNYLITPLVYSKRDKIDPVSSLFVFFTASTIFGFLGILLSMPIYFSIRALFKLYENDWELEGLDDDKTEVIESKE